MTHTFKIFWGVAGLCLVAYIVIALVSDQIFERVPHSEDEVAYIFQAKVFAQNRLTVPTPPHHDAFWSPFVVDYQGQRFGKYHPGWPLLLSLGVRLNAPWLINALLGTLSLALIAWLGYRVYHTHNQTTPYLPLLAAGLGLLTPGFLFLSSSLLSHGASLFWTTITLVALTYLTPEPNTPPGLWPKATESPQPKPETRNPKPETQNPKPETRNPKPETRNLYAIIIGFAFGASFITRPFAALGIGVALGIFLLILMIRGELKWTILLWLALGGLPVIILLPLYWWRITGSPTFNGYLLVWPYDRIGFGPDVGPEGYTLYDAIFLNTTLKVKTLARGLFGWPGWTNLFFLPLAFVTRKANRWDGLLLGTILGMIVIHNFYWAFGGVDGGFPRYYYDALPALILLTARGILISHDYLRQRVLVLPWHPPGRGKTDRIDKPEPTGSLSNRAHPNNYKIQLSWLLIGILLLFTGHNLIFNLPSQLVAQKGKYNITAASLHVVEQTNISEPALILVKDVAHWSDFAAPFVANSPSLDGPIVYAIDWIPSLTRQLRQQFAGRECWELQRERLRPCPAMNEP